MVSAADKPVEVDLLWEKKHRTMADKAPDKFKRTGQKIDVTLLAQDSSWKPDYLSNKNRKACLRYAGDGKPPLNQQNDQISPIQQLEGVQ